MTCPDNRQPTELRRPPFQGKATPVKLRPMKPVLVALLWLAIITPAFAQPPRDGSQAAPAPVAFVNVNVIPMDRERVEQRQTVVVRGDRIAAIGAANDISVPEGAVVIDGAGRYLLPGLTDAHVHLPGTVFARSRPDFGDGVLYLAFGVTNVMNLGGTATDLEWRRRVESGEILGPTIYTSGQFVNEPRVNTIEDVQREVDAHVRDGYDIIKFREVMDPSGRFTATSRGLALPVYRKLNEAAREAGIPLVGHAPVNLGLDALLETRQNLAHTGALSNIYFLPLASSPGYLVATGAAFSTLVVVASSWAFATLIRRRRPGSRDRPPTLSRIRSLTRWVLVAAVIALVCAALFLPGGPLFESRALRLLFTAAAGFVAVAAVAVSLHTFSIWRENSASRLGRMQASLVSMATLQLAYVLVSFWVPVAWRSNDSGIERLAQRVRDSGISVQTTLINYELLSGPERLALIQEPAMEYLDQTIQTRWRRLPQAGSPGYAYHRFMKRVAGALHRAGVPLIAGTDAFGVPLLIPGASLHRELQLLTESGLTPYEAIRAATVNPTIFLRKEEQFGTVAAGKRADLLLVAGDPLQDLTWLREPVGVMVRGRWFAREDLHQRLAQLASSRTP
jgi:predicted amidohydrolase